MLITWLGYNCLRLQGKDVNVIIDPFGEDVGKMARVQSDIAVYSRPSELPDKFPADAFVIKTPGEFEIKGAFVYGVGRKNQKNEPVILYRVNLEDIAIGYIGSLDQLISEDELEILEGVDILAVPVGDPDSLNAKDAAEMVSRIEPRIVLPIGYASSNVKKKLGTPADFLKQLGLPAETVDKLKITRKDLPEEERLAYQLTVS